uniref:Fur family transcriptional regulator n=1 Tax=Pelagibacter ubique TaxID=198252 RepID=UPI000AA82A80
EANEKISLATVYNTIHAFEKKGYLKEIPIDSNQSYFDTNVTDHHHFYDISEKKLIDLDEVDVGPINIQKSIPGKKIKSVEVLVKLDTDNQ